MAIIFTSVKRPELYRGNIIDSDAQSGSFADHTGRRSEVMTLTRLEDGGGALRPDADWADGGYTLTVEVTDNAGNVRRSTPLIVT